MLLAAVGSLAPLEIGIPPEIVTGGVVLQALGKALFLFPAFHPFVSPLGFEVCFPLRDSQDS